MHNSHRVAAPGESYEHGYHRTSPPNFVYSCTCYLYMKAYHGITHSEQRSFCIVGEGLGYLKLTGCAVVTDKWCFITTLYMLRRTILIVYMTKFS